MFSSLILALLLAGGNQSFALTEPDVEAPVVTGASESMKSATAGDVVTVTLSISDASGVDAGRSWLSVQLAGSDVSYYPHLVSNGDGTYSASLAVDSGWVDGEYTVTQVHLYDSVGNSAAQVIDDPPSFAVFGCQSEDDPPSWSGVTVDVEQAEFVYDGYAKTPRVDVKKGNISLVKDVDYSVEYSNNVDPGTGEITVTGLGNYRGTIKKSFVIRRADIGTASVSMDNNCVYSGFSRRAVRSWCLTGRCLLRALITISAIRTTSMPALQWRL